MPNLGMGELIIVLLIVLVVFGASRLPQIGEGLGKAVRNLKRGLQTDEEIDVTPKDKHVSDSSSAKDASEATKNASASSNVSDAEVVEKKS